MAEPPSDAGGAKVTVSSALPLVNVGWAGASGTVLGTAAADAVEGRPVPSAFVAVTVQV